MNDFEALALLRLLHKYVEEFGSSTNMTISELAEDLAMSMDETIDEADFLRAEIERMVTVG